MSVRQTLLTLSEEMEPARLPDDLWQRGRRRRRRDRLAAVVAVLVVALASVPVIGRDDGSERFGGDFTAVPSTVYNPWMWQATVSQSPRGPATLLFSGDSSVGLSGPDLLDHEGKVAVVGRDGSYRMLLRGGVQTVAGDDVLISPDGRYVAADFLYGGPDAWLVVADLRTGRIRGYDGNGAQRRGRHATPLAWSADGSTLLALETDNYYTAEHPEGLLVLVNVVRGDVIGLSRFDDVSKVPGAATAALSPNGGLIAATRGSSLALTDPDSSPQWTVSLDSNRYLAGAAAFTPDGSRIATVTLDGCAADCDTARLAARRWRLGFLDADTGGEVDGPRYAPVTGMAVRLVGWRHGTDPVLVVYHPEAGLTGSAGAIDYWQIGDAKLVALRPDGAEPEVLLDPPDNVVGLDVPGDLIEAGRFGGPGREPDWWPPRPLLYVPVTLLLLAVAAAAAAVAVAARRPLSARRSCSWGTSRTGT